MLSVHMQGRWTRSDKGKGKGGGYGQKRQACLRVVDMDMVRWFYPVLGLSTVTKMTLWGTWCGVPNLLQNLRVLRNSRQIMQILSSARFSEDESG